MSTVLTAREPSARYLVNDAATAVPLVREFDVMATAPGGVARLRQLILTLAVRGKLVPQRSDDEPAITLLVRIRAERARHATGATPRREVSAESGTGDDLPFELPTGWVGARFGEYILELCTGPFGSLIHKEDYVSGGVPLINPSHMIDGRIAHDTDVAVSPAMAAKLGAYRLVAGDVLLARRGEVGRYALVTDREQGWLCGTGSFFVKLSAECDRSYFGLIMEDPCLRHYLLGESVGSTMTNLNQRILLGAALAIPPLAEQARIVARVDELMRLCDALAAKGRLEAEQHARLLGALLGTLTDSTSPEELAKNWQRVVAHFDLLLDRPEAVAALEQTIVHLAVRGLLVPQNVSDEPAVVLRRKAQSGRAQQVEVDLSKHDSSESSLSAEDAPFDVPLNWRWIRFDDLIEPSKPIAYGVLVPGPEVSGGVPLVRIADLSLTAPPEKPEKSISAEVDAQYQRTRLEGGEILMGVVGSVGKLGVAPASWAGANIARAVCRIVPVDLVDRSFVSLLLGSEFMQSSFAGDTRTLAQPTLNIGLIRSSPTPLPPRAEQTRIVARVTELRRLCADLRQRLAVQQTVQSHLADALVESAVA